MIDSKFHVELDGEPYRIDERAEGEGYVAGGEPLRPPNAVTIQGENTQKFQARADMLVWNWTDWSKGEGKRQHEFGVNGRSWHLDKVRAFEEPGHLSPGWYVEVTQDSTGAADLAKSLALVNAVDNLYGLDTAAANAYLWDGTNNKWGAAVALTGVTNGAENMAIGDREAMYWVESSTNNVWKWDGSGAPATISTALITGNFTSLAQNEAYVYVYRPASAKVWEIAKSGASGIEIDSWTETSVFPVGYNSMAVLDGKIYIITTSSTHATIREITPTSAAGTGFGAEIARFQGFKAEALWAHAGTLYVLGAYAGDDDVVDDVTVLYLTPGGEYGSLGQIRRGDLLGQGSGGASRLLEHYFVQRRLDATTDVNHALFQIDSITGAIACVAYDETGDATGENVMGVTAFNGDIFWSTIGTATTKRVMRADPSRYQTYGAAYSSEHDFDLSTDKYLGSMSLSCAPLPTSWRIYLRYQLDNDGTWTTLTYSDTGGTGFTFPVSSSAATKQFKTMQMQVSFYYSGAGVPTSAPQVHAVEARAAVADKVKVWRMVLDLSDDHSGGKQSKSGSSKVDTFVDTVTKDTLVEFKDGYTDRRSGKYTTYSSVMVDSYQVVLDRPGEGIGIVSLRERV